MKHHILIFHWESRGLSSKINLSKTNFWFSVENQIESLILDQKSDKPQLSKNLIDPRYQQNPIKPRYLGKKSDKPQVLGTQIFFLSSCGPALMARGCFGALRLAAARPIYYTRVQPQCDFSILRWLSSSYIAVFKTERCRCGSTLLKSLDQNSDRIGPFSGWLGFWSRFWSGPSLIFTVYQTLFRVFSEVSHKQYSIPKRWMLTAVPVQSYNHPCANVRRWRATVTVQAQPCQSSTFSPSRKDDWESAAAILITTRCISKLQHYFSNPKHKFGPNHNRDQNSSLVRILI